MMKDLNKSGRAVVVGGSTACLPAKARLPHFGRVTIVDAGPDRDSVDSTPTMSLTGPATQIWEIPEPAPLEFPLPSHEPAVPSPEPVGA
jgi:hypothetical protein